MYSHSFEAYYAARIYWLHIQSCAPTALNKIRPHFFCVWCNWIRPYNEVWIKAHRVQTQTQMFYPLRSIQLNLFNFHDWASCLIEGSFQMNHNIQQWQEISSFKNTYVTEKWKIVRVLSFSNIQTKRIFYNLNLLTFLVCRVLYFIKKKKCVCIIDSRTDSLKHLKWMTTLQRYYAELLL